MRTVFALIKRNRQLFFRDKGMLISSLITPIILIVLYATFLQNVYKDSLQSALPGVMNVSEKLVNGTVAGQLAAALLAVSCVTVTFCVNLTMIQDKASGARKDFDVSPLDLCETYGMVSEWNRYCMDHSGCDFVSIIWRSAVQYHLLSAEDAGTAVSCWNDRECRIWICLRCLYAYV